MASVTPSRPLRKRSLGSVLARCEADLPPEDHRETYVRLEAGQLCDFMDGSLALGQFPFGEWPNASFNVVESGSDVVISYVAVPESTSIAVLGAGAALLGLHIARRRKA